MKDFLIIAIASLAGLGAFLLILRKTGGECIP